MDTIKTTTTTVAPLLTIHVQGKPVSVNRMYGSTRTGRKYVTQEAMAWQGAVWAASYAARMGIPSPYRGHYPLVLPPNASYRVVCTFYRVRGDADNYLKCCLDGLKTGIRVDDRHFTIVESHISDDRTQPQGALIEVYAATPQQAA